jgi:hypothetical protein
LIDQRASAEINIYQDTDNTGASKFERIGVIEKYLISLSGTLKSMEEKVDANSKKLKSLEESIGNLKDKDLKTLSTKVNEMAEAKKKETKDSRPIFYPSKTTI